MLRNLNIKPWGWVEWGTGESAPQDLLLQEMRTGGDRKGGRAVRASGSREDSDLEVAPDWKEQ